MKRIVVGYDGSSPADAALALAAARAGKDGEVVIVHSVTPATPPAEWWDARIYADIVEAANAAGRRMLVAARRTLEGDRQTVRTELASGPAAYALEAIAESTDADEIVVGSRGVGRISAVAVGSVSHSLLHLAKRPVVVAGKATDFAGPVVVGFDGSVPSRAALAYARAGLGARRLFVVCAAERVPGYLGDPYRQHALDAALGRARECADDARDWLGSEDGIEIEVLEGPPADALAHVAATRGASEIVVGSRGFGVVRGSLGSTSHELLRTAQAPVVVLPVAAVPSVLGPVAEVS